MIGRRALSNKVVQPDYAGLTGVIFHGRSEGLVVNSDNGFGTIDVSGNVTAFKSVSPHATGVTFGPQGTSPTLSGGSMVFGGAGNLRHTGASSVFNTLHYRSSINDLKWAIHGVIKVGNSDNPNTFYSITGNNGGASTTKGITFGYDDRASIPTNNSITISITRGTTQSFIALSGNTNIWTPNRELDFWIQVDKSLDQEDQVKVFINGFRFVVSMRMDTASMVTTPTYAMEIGATGNAVGRAVMTLKEITIQDALNTDAFRQTFITNRMFKYGITAFPSVVDGIVMTSDWVLTNVFDENRYYLTNNLCQSPLNSNKIVSIFHDTVTHLYDAASKISRRISTDKGLTWSAKSTVFDPSGADSARDQSAGYGDDGRLHMITGTCTSLSGGGVSVEKLWYTYSDDDGATWSTASNITSILPADSLNGLRCYCTIIENSGRLMTAIYKTTDEGDATNSANYLIYSDDNGTTWGYKTIRASAATFIDESDIVVTTGNNLLIIARNDSTFEWTQFRSTDNGDTWTNDGDCSFGESFSQACPVRLKKLTIASTDIIACYYSDRARDVFRVIYAKASDIVSSGVSAWNQGTKIVLHQGSNAEHLHYGDVCHYNGGFEAIAMYAIDPYPPSGGGTDNEMYTIKLPTFHYPFVKTAFGL